MQFNRLFFALWPTDAVRAACANATRELKVRLQPGGSPSAPDRYHLTLLFLGDQVQAAHEAAAIEAARSVRAAPFMLTLDQAGSFRHPRAMPWWLGARRTPDGIAQLYERLREAMLRANAPIERMRFTPHLTVFRADRALPPTPIAPIAWPVDEFVLVRSHFDQQPMRYELLGRWPLTGALPPETAAALPPQLDLGF
jgi:2'-5' RNA ligase